MFALTDLEICTMGLCATIVLCTIGLANSIYRDLRGPPSTSVMRFGVPPTFTRSDPIVGLLIVWPDCKPRLKRRTEGWQQRNCPNAIRLLATTWPWLPAKMQSVQVNIPQWLRLHIGASFFLGMTGRGPTVCAGAD